VTNDIARHVHKAMGLSAGVLRNPIFSPLLPFFSLLRRCPRFSDYSDPAATSNGAVDREECMRSQDSRTRSNSDHRSR